MTDTLSDLKQNRVLNELIAIAAGKVYQSDTMSFSFNNAKRPEVLEWLEERRVNADNSGRYTAITFKDTALAVEFKLRFMAI